MSPAPGRGTAELWEPKESHSCPFSECKATQKMFTHPGAKMGFTNDGLN